MTDMVLTEKKNPATVNIDLLSSREIVNLINLEDYKAVEAVKKELDEIAKAIDAISDCFLDGKSLLYFGAGTSGRLGILDASECPPTFGVSPEMVRGYIAGGDKAIKSAVEGAEDSFDGGAQDLINSGAKSGDIVIGISACGNAQYISGVLSKAKELKILTIGLVCNKQAKIKEYCDIFISPETGEEVITGSTRMKAGTAQKMVLNMLTTASMIRIGKTYENYMIDVTPTNNKLKDRAIRIVSEIAQVGCDRAQESLKNSNFDVKAAIVMLKTNINLDQAQKILKKNNGRLRETLKMQDK